MTGRGGWHRRVGWLPLTYLGGIVAIGFAHPLLAHWWWLGVHVLLLGAVTNAILIWSTHFALAVLRAPAPASRRGEALRLAALNIGIVAVLAGGSGGLAWVGVAGAVVVFAAICAHLHSLRVRLRAALPAPYAGTVHYYVAATVALLTGIPVGAWMLVADTAVRPRLLLFHAHVNLLGWVTLTVLGTLLTLWPTVLRTRVVEGAIDATRAGLPVAVAGLAVLSVAVIVWSPLAAVGGLTLLAIAVLVVLGPAVRAAWRKPPTSFAAWSMAAAALWLLVALGIDGGVLATAGSPEAAADRFDTVLVPLLVGFVAQTLIGALSYLLPVGLGGGPAQVRAADAALDRRGPQRVVMANLALVVFVLPVDAYVRVITSVLVLLALVQFLIPAVRLIWRSAWAGRRLRGGTQS
ncbi:MAG TPA: hypothetical protein VH561_11165 [Micromonosporaceae bacterium]|jgi:nitrite reductase (NO-forming)